jgi:hypothetical protein
MSSHQDFYSKIKRCIGKIDSYFEGSFWKRAYKFDEGKVFSLIKESDREIEEYLLYSDENSCGKERKRLRSVYE